MATSEEELLFISEHNEVILTGKESIGVADLGASFHLTHDEGCFSLYTTDDHDFVKMRNEGAS